MRSVVFDIVHLHSLQPGAIWSVVFLFRKLVFVLIKTCSVQMIKLQRKFYMENN